LPGAARRIFQAFASSAPTAHQFLPVLGFRDAVGNHTLATERALDAANLGGDIWTEGIDPRVETRTRRYRDFPGFRASRSHQRVLLYQAASGSNGMVAFLLGRPEPKTLYFHNITPAELFDPYDARAAAVLRRARDELVRLAAQVPLAMAASDFNARELRALGIGEVRVIPPYLSPAVDVETDISQLTWLTRTKKGTDILFVSRIAPHKGHAHLLRAFSAFRATVDPRARLFCVGEPGPELYMHALGTMSVEGVSFTGSLPAARLNAYYRVADVFLCLSEHEGFGLPLIEAMRFDLPVVAYDAAAVAETLGGSGVLLRSLDPRVVAEVVGRVAGNGALRAEICRRQHARVAQLESIPRDRLIVETVLQVMRGG